MTTRLAPWLTLLLFLSIPAAFGAEEADPETAYAERLLKEAKVETDGPGLLAYLRSKTLSEAELERLAQLIPLLGDDSYEVRQKTSKDLVAAGRVAIPFLKAALKDSDREIVRRAERCLDEIESSQDGLQTSAAARLLGHLNPEGAAEALLAYLPCAVDELAEDAVFDALVRVGLRDGKPTAALTAALTDKHPFRRAAAAHVVARSANAEDQRRIAKLLKDEDPRARYEAAAGLIYSGDKSAVPTLLALLGDGPLAIGWQAEDLLCRIAGDELPATALGSGSDAERRKARDFWERWWKDHGEKADLTKLEREKPLRHLTLVSEYDGNNFGRVAEYGRDGKERWHIDGLSGPNDVQLLPGGRVLVAERNANRVRERDRQGKEIWNYATRDAAIACQRLRNGNTLIATFGELLEVTPKGEAVHTHKHAGGYRHALQMRNGHVIFISTNGEVVELDAEWKHVRTITPAKYGQGATFWASVEPLPGGRFLLALGGAGKVVEIDGAGKIVWECDQPSAVFATRLRNGNTLISSFEHKCLVEVDRNGKEVNKQELPGRPFAVRRY
jgi:hypothetical protein